MTRRQARRKLGSRKTRRSATNGKVLFGTGGGNRRSMCRRNPQPVKNLGWRVRAILQEANSKLVAHNQETHA